MEFGENRGFLWDGLMSVKASRCFAKCSLLLFVSSCWGWVLPSRHDCN
jgi:hypothetical protein